MEIDNYISMSIEKNKLFFVKFISGLVVEMTYACSLFSLYKVNSVN